MHTISRNFTKWLYGMWITKLLTFVANVLSKFLHLEHVYHDNFNNCWLVGTVLETLQYCEHCHPWLVRRTSTLVMLIKMIWFIHRYYVCSHHLGLLIFMCSQNLNWSIQKFHKSTLHVVQGFLKLSVEVKLRLQIFLKNYHFNSQGIVDVRW